MTRALDGKRRQFLHYRIWLAPPHQQAGKIEHNLAIHHAITHSRVDLAEVFAAVGFALAVARPQPRPGILGLDAIPEPVCAAWGAGFVAQRAGELPGMLLLGVRLGALHRPLTPAVKDL
jgi:hypothetical protein